MGIFDIIFLVFIVFGVAIGVHRGLFDQLLSWAQILLVIFVPCWLGNAMYFSKAADGSISLSGMGSNLAQTMEDSLALELPDPAINFINSKFLPQSIEAGYTYEDAYAWLYGTMGNIVLKLIIFAIMLVLVIVGIHFAGHYIEKYRRLRRTFRTVDTWTGAAIGLVNAYVAFCLVLGLINLLPNPVLQPIAEMIREGGISASIYDANFIGNCIAMPYTETVESITKLLTIFAF